MDAFEKEHGLPMGAVATPTKKRKVNAEPTGFEGGAEDNGGVGGDEGDSDDEEGPEMKKKTPVKKARTIKTEPKAGTGGRKKKDVVVMKAEDVVKTEIGEDGVDG